MTARGAVFSLTVDDGAGLLCAACGREAGPDRCALAPRASGMTIGLCLTCTRVLRDGLNAMSARYPDLLPDGRTLTLEAPCPGR